MRQPEPFFVFSPHLCGSNPWGASPCAEQDPGQIGRSVSVRTARYFKVLVIKLHPKLQNSVDCLTKLVRCAHLTLSTSERIGNFKADSDSQYVGRTGSLNLRLANGCGPFQEETKPSKTVSHQCHCSEHSSRPVQDGKITSKMGTDQKEMSRNSSLARPRKGLSRLLVLVCFKGFGKHVEHETPTD